MTSSHNDGPSIAVKVIWYLLMAADEPGFLVSKTWRIRSKVRSIQDVCAVTSLFSLRILESVSWFKKDNVQIQRKLKIS